MTHITLCWTHSTIYLCCTHSNNHNWNHWKYTMK